jgi:UDP-N-acetylmuramoyl-tripeptide--D-alanyl-D-alanine ligase
MRPALMSEVARSVDGTLVGSDVEVSSVVTDSRAAVPGALFVALTGQRTDGGLFIPQAFELGAAGALVRDGVRVAGPAVVVRSTGDALLRLAAHERRSMRGRVVAITGANGKTSTKDMTAGVVASRFLTHSSPESFNNEVGLPVTLLGAGHEVEVVVAEMGARRKGDVTLLCEVARPDIVVVTNVGLAHMEIFGSWEAIVDASAEPVDALGRGGVAVLNADDPVAAGFGQRCAGRVVTFGRTRSADVRADAVTLDPAGLASFGLVHDSGKALVSMSVPGEHMVSNALAAASVGLELGITVQECAAALSEVRVSHWRMETFSTAEGIRVVNDAYNANPESVAAALKTARWMAGDARLIVVMGTMAELGPISETEHERVGELAARLRVDRLVTVGAQASTIAIAAVREGIEPSGVASYDDIDDALGDVRAHARPDDVVLFKASRVAGLERLAEALR